MLRNGQSRFQIPTAAWVLCLLQSARTGYGTESASYFAYRNSFLGVNLLWPDVDNSLPFNAEVKKWLELYLYSFYTPSGWRLEQLCFYQMQEIFNSQFTPKKHFNYVLEVAIIRKNRRTSLSAWRISIPMLFKSLFRGAYYFFKWDIPVVLNIR